MREHAFVRKHPAILHQSRRTHVNPDTVAKGSVTLSGGEAFLRDGVVHHARAGTATVHDSGANREVRAMFHERNRSVDRIDDECRIRSQPCRIVFRFFG
jgi:hypothetical protein